MALIDDVKRILNSLNISARKVKAGDYLVQQATRKGVAVPDISAAPTQADFNALLASLRNAGLIA